MLRPMTNARWTTKHELLVGMAIRQGGVVSRRQAAQCGFDYDAVAWQLRRGRWAAHGWATLSLDRNPLSLVAQRWRAVWETGEGSLLDGVSALAVAGMVGFDESRQHVSVVHNRRAPRTSGVVVHKVIRRVDREQANLNADALPITRPEVAALRGARWAVTDRQAVLILAMAVQQRLVTPAQLAAMHRVAPGRNRRRLIKLVIGDLAGGAQSLGELDFAAMCRRRGLPEPSRQVVVEGARGRIYLDVRWDDYGLIVEIDGAGHRRGLAVTDDNLRMNSLVLGHELVLRIDVLGLRIMGDEFMNQVAQGLSSRDRRQRPRLAS